MLVTIGTVCRPIFPSRSPCHLIGGLLRRSIVIHSDSKRFSIVIATLSLGVLSLATALHAGLSFGSRGRTVGGVVIDPAGMVRAATIEDRQELANQLQNANQVLQGD